MATIHLNDKTFVFVNETADEIDKLIKEMKHKGKDEIFIKVNLITREGLMRKFDTLDRIQIKRIIEYYD